MRARVGLSLRHRGAVRSNLALAAEGVVGLENIVGVARALRGLGARRGRRAVEEAKRRRSASLTWGESVAGCASVVLALGMKTHDGVYVLSRVNVWTACAWSPFLSQMLLTLLMALNAGRVEWVVLGLEKLVEEPVNGLRARGAPGQELTRGACRGGPGGDGVQDWNI